jgi:hypothetical protein
MSSTAYVLTIVGHTPVLVEYEQVEFGDDPVVSIRIGGLVLRVSPELAEQLADGIIDAAADDPVPVRLT